MTTLREAAEALDELQAVIDDTDCWPRYSSSIKSSMAALRSALSSPPEPVLLKEPPPVGASFWKDDLPLPLEEPNQTPEPGEYERGWRAGYDACRDATWASLRIVLPAPCQSPTCSCEMGYPTETCTKNRVVP